MEARIENTIFLLQKLENATSELPAFQFFFFLYVFVEDGVGPPLPAAHDHKNKGHAPMTSVAPESFLIHM